MSRGPAARRLAWALAGLCLSLGCQALPRWEGQTFANPRTEAERFRVADVRDMFGDNYSALSASERARVGKVDLYIVASADPLHSACQPHQIEIGTALLDGLRPPSSDDKAADAWLFKKRVAFILAQELGHLVKGHCRSTTSWGDEVAADAFAVELLGRQGLKAPQLHFWQFTAVARTLSHDALAEALAHASKLLDDPTLLRDPRQGEAAFVRFAKVVDACRAAVSLSRRYLANPEGGRGPSRVDVESAEKLAGVCRESICTLLEVANAALDAGRARELERNVYDDFSTLYSRGGATTCGPPPPRRPTPK